MKPTLLVVSVALALGTLAACDRNPNPQQRPATTPPSSTAPSSTAPSSAATGSSGTTTSSTSSTAKSDGAHPPAQGQVDAKQPEQQKDFQQKGDSAGPKK
jgi:hypothetical protein